MNKKNKGFTLIELLAVIVILAVLVLVATPAVTSIMTKSSRNSFKNEVLSFVKDFEKAYTDKIGDEVKSDDTTSTSTSLSSALAASNSKTKIKNVVATDSATNETKRYAYLCMSLNDLVNEQYTKKDLGTSYGGTLEMWVPDGAGETITYVEITNNRFVIVGRTSEITKSGYDAIQLTGDKISPSEIECSGDGTTIPNNTNENFMKKGTD